jgi:hypothetical protein
MAAASASDRLRDRNLYRPETKTALTTRPGAAKCNTELCLSSFPASSPASGSVRIDVATTHGDVAVAVLFLTRGQNVAFAPLGFVEPVARCIHFVRSSPAFRTGDLALMQAEMRWIS